MAEARAENRRRFQARLLTSKNNKVLLRPKAHPARWRSESKYRIFDECVIEELALIKTLKVMDFGLVDIKSILEARRSGFCTCSYLKGTIKSKINSVDEKIKELQQVLGQLLSLIGNWRDCGGIKANPEASSVFVEPYTKASPEELLL